jgi:CheY-like chemotaxis protein
VVAVTANAMPHDIQRGKRAGFAEYLTKPIDISTLMGTIECYLKDTKISLL